MSFWWMAAALAQAPAEGSAPECDLAPLRFAERAQHVVTSAPGDEPFSYIGHVGLWIRDAQRRIDHIIEFGAIDSRKQDPLTALLLGDLECWWRVRPYEREFDYYERADRLAVARHIQLPPLAEQAFVEQLYGIAGSADDVSFDFHWRENSCSTAIRDILDDVTGGQISAQISGPGPLTARGEVLRHFERVSWAWFGWSLLAGAEVDRPLSKWEALFVPRRLVLALDEITVKWPDGSMRPLIAETCTIYDGRNTWPAETPPNRTLPLWAAGLLFGGGLAAVGTRRRRLVGVAAALLGLIGGLLGTVDVVLYAVSSLDAYGPNRNWLVISPLSFVLLPLGIAWARGRAPGWGRTVTTALAVVGLLGLPLMLVPILPQADHFGFLGLFLPSLVALAWLARRPVSP